MPWTEYKPKRPVPAIIFHGTLGPLVAFHGGPSPLIEIHLRPRGLSGVIALAAQGDHDLALKQDGTSLPGNYRSALSTDTPRGLRRSSGGVV